MPLRHRTALFLALLCGSAAAPAMQPDETAIFHAQLAGQGTKLAMNRYWYDHEKWPASADELDHELPPENTSEVSVDESTGVITVRITEPAELAGKSITLTPTHQPDLTIDWACKPVDIEAYMLPRC